MVSAEHLQRGVTQPATPMSLPPPDAARFPRTAQYDPAWVYERSMGGNVLLSLESLLRLVPLEAGMRVLDLGCGQGATSVFLAKEYGVAVWALDVASSPSQNQAQFERWGMGRQCTALQLDTRNLPFAHGFFDAIVCVNSYGYFGTDDKYLPYVARFLSKGGYLALSDIGFTSESSQSDPIGPSIKKHFHTYWYHVHALQWWQHHLQKTGLVRVTTAQEIPDAEAIKEAYLAYNHERGALDAFAAGLVADTTSEICFWELVAQRTELPAYLETY